MPYIFSIKIFFFYFQKTNSSKNHSKSDQLNLQATNTNQPKKISRINPQLNNLTHCKQPTHKSTQTHKN